MNMHCIEITKPGDASVLQETLRPVPVPQAREVLIKVAACGVNRPDVLQRKGLYKHPVDSSDLPGLEVAGEVESVGAEVTGYSKGDSVCALSPGGGYAEYCIVPEVQVLPIPRGLNFVEAATLPEVFFTVWLNLYILGGLHAGESLLVHGGSGGIGTAAIQLAKALGARVFTTAGSSQKCAACLELGADVAINYREQDFVKNVNEATDGKGVNMVLDYVGGDYVAKNLSVLSRGGHLVNLYFLNGSKVEIDLMPILTKGLTFTGSMLRPQPLKTKLKIRNDLVREVWPLIESGRIKPVIFKTFPLVDASQAHALMESSRHVGKIVLLTTELNQEMI
jgi:NADPH2:quinone reductase